MADLAVRVSKTRAEKLAILDRAAAAINKTAGKTIAGRIGASPELMDRLRIEYIPTPSSDLNDAMGGGVPKGRTTIAAGLPDSGKTSLFLETIAKNQKADPDFVAGWLESEGSLVKEYICDTFGIDPDRFFFLEMDRAGAGEIALDRVEAVMSTGCLDIMVINSLKALVPSEEITKSLSNVVVGTQSRMNARMCRKFTALVAESNTAYVIITHLSVNIGSSSKDPLIVSGGHAIAFSSAMTLDMRKQSIGDSDPIKKEEGVKIGVRIRKNHCVPDRNPYLKTEYYAIFGKGIEQYLTTLDKAVNQGILRKAGAWIYDDESSFSWQGKEKYRQHMIEFPDYFNSLLSKVDGAISMTAEEVDDIKADEKAIEEMASASVKESKKTKKAV